MIPNGPRTDDRRVQAAADVFLRQAGSIPEQKKVLQIQDQRAGRAAVVGEERLIRAADMKGGQRGGQRTGAAGIDENAAVADGEEGGDANVAVLDRHRSIRRVAVDDLDAVAGDGGNIATEAHGVDEQVVCVDAVDAVVVVHDVVDVAAVDVDSGRVVVRQRNAVAAGVVDVDVVEGEGAGRIRDVDAGVGRAVDGRGAQSDSEAAADVVEIDALSRAVGRAEAVEDDVQGAAVDVDRLTQTNQVHAADRAGAHVRAADAHVVGRVADVQAADRVARGEVDAVAGCRADRRSYALGRRIGRGAVGVGGEDRRDVDALAEELLVVREVDAVGFIVVAAVNEDHIAGNGIGPRSALDRIEIGDAGEWVRDRASVEAAGRGVDEPDHVADRDRHRRHARRVEAVVDRVGERVVADEPRRRIVGEAAVGIERDKTGDVVESHLVGRRGIADVAGVALDRRHHDRAFVGTVAVVREDTVGRVDCDGDIAGAGVSIVLRHGRVADGDRHRRVVGIDGVCETIVEGEVPGEIGVRGKGERAVGVHRQRAGAEVGRRAHRIVGDRAAERAAAEGGQRRRQVAQRVHHRADGAALDHAVRRVDVQRGVQRRVVHVVVRRRAEQDLDVHRRRVAVGIAVVDHVLERHVGHVHPVVLIRERAVVV
ncbi:MAG: hypothetical protein MI923_03240 [Phycisphaerales bacterium]|nr:hypothetical protein [Phycisphaerales bacterium]